MGSDIQRSICDYLSYRKHFFGRQNTAPSVQKAADGWKFHRMPKYAMRDVPDIIVVHNGRPYFLEVKRNETYQSPEQKVGLAFKPGAGQLAFTDARPSLCCRFQARSM
jgi:hypothetical protein